MTADAFDLKSLQSRIENIKEEGKETTDFTYEYIECLMVRHDLKDCVPEDYELEDVPDIILEKICKGEIPSKEELLLMDNETQNYLLFELIYFCGMGAIAAYEHSVSESSESKKSEEDELDSENEEEFSFFESILEMRDISPAHYMGSYLAAALALLMCSIPSFPFIELLTSEFDESNDQMQQNLVTFSEIAASILTRHKEDKMYWGIEDEEEE
jgi:hypothetical protein